MAAKATFIREVTVKDPDNGAAVQISVFKHSNGGMFGLDTSFITQVLDDDDEETLRIPDPFEPQIKGVNCPNDGVELYGI